MCSYNGKIKDPVITFLTNMTRTKIKGLNSLQIGLENKMSVCGVTKSYQDWECVRNIAIHMHTSHICILNAPIRNRKLQ